MLDGVVDHYLQSVTEREFDAPLMALLVSRNFYDIHKIHGTFEFGKDFIAKREADGVIHQYALQSKAGDINLATWLHDVKPQVDTTKSHIPRMIDRCEERLYWLPRAGSLGELRPMPKSIWSTWRPETRLGLRSGIEMAFEAGWFAILHAV